MSPSDSDAGADAPADPEGGDRSSTVERSIVGALLAVLALVGLAWALQIPAGNVVGGGIGLLVGLSATVLLVRLFLEGVDEPVEAEESERASEANER